ncbi:unnamed protein product [Paramecium pentaurelia]|uniref:Uncharacterized protein n=1 Tax=Paramecium pentaurelia TaxID=43138 RepID=A0A8S1XDB7_9CILI|nr:unnamed protein product [Paramecium pentaurelia]
MNYQRKSQQYVKIKCEFQFPQKLRIILLVIIMVNVQEMKFIQQEDHFISYGVEQDILQNYIQLNQILQKSSLQQSQQILEVSSLFKILKYRNQNL